MDAKYQIGDRVKRIENRTVVGAVVTAVENGPDGWIYEIDYDEGGSGWWPEECLAEIADA